LRRGTEALAPAAATFETIRRTFVKITVHVVELMVVIKLPSGRHACGDDGRDHDAGPMIDGARAAKPQPQNVFRLSLSLPHSPKLRFKGDTATRPIGMG